MFQNSHIRSLLIVKQSLLNFKLIRFSWYTLSNRSFFLIYIALSNTKTTLTPPLNQILPGKSRKYSVPTVFTYSYLKISINLINGKKNWLKNIFNDRWRQSWISDLLCLVVVIRSSCRNLVSPEYTSIFSRYPLETSRQRRGGIGFWGHYIDVNGNSGGQSSPTKCREESIKNWLAMKGWGEGGRKNITEP